MVFSENGIIAKAREAADKTNQAVINEQEQMNELADYMENMLNGIDGNTTPEEPTLPSDGSYSETKGVNTPKLGAGMTPIKWNGSSWEETTGDDPEWYDYTAKKWANAKVEVEGVESYFVWIPRYAYSIKSMYHTKGDATTAGTIEVEFIKGLTNETSTGRTSFQNASGQGNWNIHPAFDYGEEVSGIWVAKFEASPVGATTTPSNSEYDGTGKKLQVVPGVSSWRSITISNAYDVCKAYNPGLNSHLMKNDEWGAVAYLSKSRYGKQNEEVWINNSSSYITGSAGNSAVASSNTGTDTNYASTQGVKASTTGNVYGVYDMSGGAWERVAAYVNNENPNLTTYGNSLYTSTDEKNKNVYIKEDDDTRLENYNTNTSKYGDAIYETSSGTYNGNDTYNNQSWYADHSSFSSASYPFFARGGDHSNATRAGVFSFIDDNGTTYEWSSFRPALVAL